MAAERILVCWVGATDLRAADGQDVGVGPVAQAIDGGAFDRLHLLSDYSDERTQRYTAWVGGRSGIELVVSSVELSSPVAFGEIYQRVLAVLDELASEPGDRELTYHLSPGTWAMAAVWFLIAKTRHPAQLLQSSRGRGVHSVDIPFDISADFLPDALARFDADLREQATARPPDAPEFAEILHRSAAVASCIRRARRVAVRNVPVLIEGESGTGKELFARAIHVSSPRRDRPFVAVNCGALTESLVESELFGHAKGAFTGAVSASRGHFRAAHRGTLFLDEIGELAPSVQVKLLRVLQEGEVLPVGESSPVPVDVRIIAATHRSLLRDAADGRFRPDLFYRLAVGVLTLPPLRARGGDVTLLADAFLRKINEENQEQPGYEPRTLSAGAKNLLRAQPWPGNVRELRNTLQRAALWSDSPRIGVVDIRSALMSDPRRGDSPILGRTIGDGFDLAEVLSEVSRWYLEQAMEQADGNKTGAARLLGLKSHQVLTSRLKKHGLED